MMGHGVMGHDGTWWDMMGRRRTWSAWVLSFEFALSVAIFALLRAARPRRTHFEAGRNKKRLG